MALVQNKLLCNNCNVTTLRIVVKAGWMSVPDNGSIHRHKESRLPAQLFAWHLNSEQTAAFQINRYPMIIVDILEQHSYRPSMSNLDEETGFSINSMCQYRTVLEFRSHVLQYCIQDSQPSRVFYITRTKHIFDILKALFKRVKKMSVF